MALFAALKRRNVLRVGAAYILVAWLVIQVVETVFPAFGYDDSATRVVVIVFAIGLIPTVVGAWVFQFTPDRLRLDKGTDHDFVSSQKVSRKLDRATIEFWSWGYPTSLSIYSCWSRTGTQHGSMPSNSIRSCPKNVRLTTALPPEADVGVTLARTAAIDPKATFEIFN